MISFDQFENDVDAGRKIAEKYGENDDFTRGFGEGFAVAMAAMTAHREIKNAGTRD